ncbi:MAG: hemerythrin domain-containing protein [Pyrinomonadaceae bacterium]|nr:hemerythrin domain-containing protein [Pyrinomonadaceae bacterium]
MPIAIGQRLESDFSNPLGLLSDCHRRLERFLDALLAISEEARGSKLSDVQSHHFEVALRYFREAAPKHTLDEEESLFPRLRLHKDGESLNAFALLDVLHADHTEAEIKHQRVDDLGRAWIADQVLSPNKSRVLVSLLKDLRATYEKHIAVEDNGEFWIGRNWKLSLRRWRPGAASWLVRACRSDEEPQRSIRVAQRAR